MIYSLDHRIAIAMLRTSLSEEDVVSGLGYMPDLSVTPEQLDDHEPRLGAMLTHLVIDAADRVHVHCSEVPNMLRERIKAYEEANTATKALLALAGEQAVKDEDEDDE